MVVSVLASVLGTIVKKLAKTKLKAISRSTSLLSLVFNFIVASLFLFL